MGTEKYAVLIVDDDKSIREQVKDYFSPAGVRVEMVSTIDDAFSQIYKMREITMALVDWEMEGKRETPHLFKYIKANASHRIIASAYTAHGGHDIHFRARMAGAKHFFVKGTPLDLIQNYMDEDFETVKGYDYDDMTSLMNDRGFRRIVVSELETARDRPHMNPSEVFSMIYLDVNHFKTINDEHGHDEGDKAIRVVAEALLKHTRRPDHLCRFHGDEFGILMTGADKGKAMSRARELEREVIAASFILDSGVKIPLSISAGVAELLRSEIGSDAEKSLDQLIKKADVEMSQVKGGGRR